MTIRAVLACDGEWVPGDPCRQAAPVGVVANGAEARRVAKAIHHWGTVMIGDSVRDLCPTCLKRHLERRIPSPRLNLKIIP